MIRRFVNLVVESGGYGRRVYSLHRLDAAKHLFYPSTADAEAAPNNDSKEIYNTSNNGGGGADTNNKQKPKPPRIRRLPSASLNFPTDPEYEDDMCYDSLGDMFTLLRPAGGGGEGRILHVGVTGHGLVYDADARSVITTVPILDEPKGSSPIAISIAGAAGGGEGEEVKERLYVMTSVGYENSFQVLDFGQKPPRAWQPLPRPLPLAGDWSSSSVTSYAVADGGRAICASCDGEDTYCFDTASAEWRHAGDWPLPFRGRAEYVPELNTWLGFCPGKPHHLCATDLSGVGTAAMSEAPTLQHVWEDFTPPPMEESSVVLSRRFPRYVLHRTKSWETMGRHLVNLGSGRFCIARDFAVVQKEWIGFDVDRSHEDCFAVLTGVEVLRSDDHDGTLRMVKHKSRCYQYAQSEDESIKWVL
jgi:hypothetical protein